MTVEKITKLTKKLLANVEYQLAEFIMTRDFNRKALDENPAKADKIVPLILTVEQDIKQTFEYQQFIQDRLNELSEKKPDEVLIILEDKKDIITGEVVANKKK